MRPYNMCLNDIHIYIGNDIISSNIVYRDVLRFSKYGLYYEIESFDWIEFYDIETQELFMEYISKYYRINVFDSINIYLLYMRLMLPI